MAPRVHVEIGASLDGTFDRAIGAANDKLRGIGRSIGMNFSSGIGGALKSVDDGFVSLGKTMQETGRGMRNWASTTQATNRQQLEAIQDQRAGYRSQLLDVAAVGTALFGLTKPAIDFEHKMTDLTKVMPDGTNIEELGTAIKNMSKDIPIAVDGLIDIAAAGARTGYTDPKEVLEYTDMVAKMALAWDMSADEAGAGIAKIGGTLKMSMEQMREFGDALNMLDDSSTATAPELIDMMKRIGSAGSEVKLTAEQTAAFATTMLDLGNTAETGATSIMNMFNVLKNAPNLPGKKADGAFRKILGIDPYDLQKVMLKDGVKGVRMFADAFNKLSEVDKVEAFADIFGTGYTDAGAAKLFNNMDKLEEYLGKVGDKSNYVNSVLTEYEKRTNTTAAGLRRLSSTAYITAIAIGDTMLGAINAVSPALSPVLDSITYLATEFPIVTQAVVGVTGSLLALGAVGAVAGYGLSFMREGLLRFKMLGPPVVAAFGSITQAVGSLALGMRAASIAMLANPVGIVVTGVALAVGAAALLIYKYWEPVSSFFSGMWDGIVTAFAPAIEKVKSAIAPLEKVFGSFGPMFDVVGSAISSVVGWFGSLFTQVDYTKEALDGVASSGRSVGEVIGTVLAKGVELAVQPLKMIGGIFQMMAGDIGGVQKTINEIAATFDSVIPGWGTAFKIVGESVGATIALLRGDFTGFKTHLMTVAEEFKQIGTAIGDAIKAGLQMAWEGIKSWFQSAIDGLLDLVPGWARSALGMPEATVSDADTGPAKTRAGRYSRRKPGPDEPGGAVAGFTPSGDLVYGGETPYFGPEGPANGPTPGTNPAGPGVGPVPGVKPSQPAADVGEVVKELKQTAQAQAKAADSSAAKMEAAIAASMAQASASLDAAMAGNVALEQARAASLAAEKPRSVTVTVTAPITVNNTGGGDVSGQVQKGVSQGAKDILQAEQDAFVDG
jgi:TP901 family phage tail tape measure protein